MPRAAGPPRAHHAALSGSRTQQNATQTSLKNVPLHDDRQEKAARLQSRQALQDLQLNSLKAAASPMRKLKDYNRADSNSPSTPQRVIVGGKENLSDGGLAVVASSVMTPAKRIPILANFEEWMKMATDNKINATNSWNFALIDYFHDMSLLKEGDGVNFQKASCTLDGCVKIYTSRVDSVASETGKLLSGLADSGGKSRKRSEDDGEGTGEVGMDDDDDAEDGSKKKTRRKAQRSSEATLAPSFGSLALKKMELEFSVDPLFKKVAADFDEGGAKGLLLNHLAIDSKGRIVFDSSDDVEDATAEGDSERLIDVADSLDINGESQDPDREVCLGSSVKVDLVGLAAKFFPDLTKLDQQDLCPSLKNFDLGNPAGSIILPNLKAPEDWPQEKNKPQDSGLGDQTGIFLDGDNIAGFDDDDEGLLGQLDTGEDAAFGEGGEVWAKNAAIRLDNRVDGTNYDENRTGEEGENDAATGVADGFNPRDNQHLVSLHLDETQGAHADILNYFDNALQKHWVGPEHWRIKRIKDLKKPIASASSKRKEKEPFEIDFHAPLDPALAELIYTPAVSSAAISLPKAQWKSKTRNLLPDDKHFNSRQLVQLFLKPKARTFFRRQGLGSRQPRERGEPAEEVLDEAFWARKENHADREAPGADAPQADYDANFFQDDDPGFLDGPPEDEMDFASARETISPVGDDSKAVGQEMSGFISTQANQEGAFGTQLVTQNRRIRPEYVQYARVAKKVDVRRLKEEMWRGIGFEENNHQSPVSTVAEQKVDTPITAPLKFTSIMNDLQQVYPQQAMADISTSYCFICLLHLANEKGLTINNEPGLEDLSIRKDFTAVITEHDA